MKSFSIQKLFYCFLILAIVTACVSPNQSTEKKEDQDLINEEGPVGGNPVPAIPEEPVVGPINTNPPISQNPTGVCSMDPFRQEDAQFLNKVDIIFVMDNSRSMSDDWERVARNLSDLAKQLPEDVNVRYAVLLGHVGPRWRGKLYSPTNTKVFDSAVMSQAKISDELFKTFKQAMKIQGDDGSGEATFYSLYYAVTERLGENQALGILRPDAAWSFVFTSDENEIGSVFPSPQAPGLPPRCDTDFEENVKKQYYDKEGINSDKLYSKIKQVRGDMPFRSHAFVNINAEDLFTNNERGASCLYDSLGYGFFDFVNKTSGILYSIQADRAQGMAKIGEVIRKDLNLMYDFKLSKSPDKIDPATIVAKVDNTSVPHKYDAQTATVHLSQSGGAGSLIEISYCEPVVVVPPAPTPVPVPDPVPPPVPTPTPNPVDWKILGFDGTTESTIANLIWQTQKIPTKAKLYIGLSAGELNYKVVDIEKFNNVHFITQEGLEPNTRYYFKVVCQDELGNVLESNIISKKTKENI